MLKGVNMSLLIGPAVPMAVPKEVIEALTSVEVTVASGQASGFQLSFELKKGSPLETMFLISGAAAIPMIRVIIVVTLNGTPEVLMDGVVVNHEVKPGDNGGPSTLTITGEDLTRVMDYIDFSGIPYPAMPDFARVGLILAKYAVLGIVPVVVPPIFTDIQIPVEKIPAQKGKDLEYVKSLADAVGHVFYLEPGPIAGTSRAYWGPEIKVGVPQPALNVNMDAHTNVESLRFSVDNEKVTMPVVYIQNSLTKFPIPIPIPDINPLNPPLGAIPPIPKNFEPLKNSAKKSAIAAALLGLTESGKTGENVSGSGSLDVLRYGRVLKARRLVGVRGAGTAFDGLYYVQSVTHQIKRGEYKQNFNLSRKGLVSITPKVPI